jgi:hypothetical protein
VPRWLALSPDRVATLGYSAVMSGRPVVLTGAAARVTGALLPLLPDALALKWLVKNEPAVPDA